MPIPLILVDRICSFSPKSLQGSCGLELATSSGCVQTWPIRSWGAMQWQLVAESTWARLFFENFDIYSMVVSSTKEIHVSWPTAGARTPVKRRMRYWEARLACSLPPETRHTKKGARVLPVPRPSMIHGTRRYTDQVTPSNHQHSPSVWLGLAEPYVPFVWSRGEGPGPRISVDPGASGVYWRPFSVCGSRPKDQEPKQKVRS